MNIKEKLSKNYWLNDPLPIMIIYIVNAVFFTNPYFRENIQPVTQIVMTVYISVLALINIFVGRYKEGNKHLLISMYAFCIINFISYLVTREGVNAYAISLIYMNIVHFLVLGLPRLDVASDKRKKDIDLVITVFVCLATVWNIFLLCYQQFTIGYSVFQDENYRLKSISGDPNRLGFFTSICALFAIYIFIIKKNIRSRVLCVISLLVNCVTLYLSKSRSSEIFLCVAVFCIIIFYVYRYKSRKILLGSFIAISVLGLAILSAIVLSRGVDRSLSTYELINSISSYRLGIYETAIRLGKESPIFGNSFQVLSQSMHVGMAHNIYLDLFARYGVFSLIAFLYFVITLVVLSLKVIRKNNKTQLSNEDFILFSFFLALIIGMLIQHLFDIYIFLSGYGAGNVFFYICSGYLHYQIARQNRN